MQNEDLHEDDWKLEAVRLASLAKDCGSGVPKGYFEEMQACVLDRIRGMSPQPEESESSPDPRLELSRFSRTRIFELPIFWSIVAGILFMVVIGAFFSGWRNDPAQGSEFANHSIQRETRLQLASLESHVVVAQLDPTFVTDEQLFAALGPEGEAAFNGTVPLVEQDDALEYLKGIYLDDIDLKNLEIDMKDLQDRY
ncbi:MAG: hypothetical protein RLZZ165_2261 [Bacteroidota bacterium]|jgi:hypothetical protein